MRRSGAWRRILSQEAQNVARPAGFADIVEKVKPAVISVRVKMRTDAQPRHRPTTRLPFPKGSPMEKFFKRFGMPEGGQGGPRAPRGRQFGQAQGSGFFISADGYAVTNNHVVDKADERRGHDRRRQDLHRQGDRHRSAHRSRADQGRRQQLPLRQACRQRRRASATGCSRSAIRSASAAP